MGEQENITEEQLKKLIESFPIEPLANRIVVTINKEEVDTELVTTNNILSEYQYVVAVGPMAERHVSAGFKVCLDLEKMTVRTPLDHDQTQVNTQIKIDPVEVEGIRYAIINDSCIKYKFKS